MFCSTADHQQHLRDWRELRQHAQCTQHVLQAFANLSCQMRYIDYYTPESWPNPFEIIEHGMYDVSGISLLIYHTLVNLNFLDHRGVTWKVISNHITGHEGLVFTDSDAMTYNFVPGQTAAPHHVIHNSTEFFVHDVVIKPI